MEQPLGVVLAGGESRRMGRDKAKIEHAGTTLAARAAERLAGVVSEIVVADRGRRTVPGRISLPDADAPGPAAGILAAATAYPERALLVLACDLPWVPTGLLRTLRDTPGDWVVPVWDRGLEPLVAVYRPRALRAVARRAAAGLGALHALAEEPDLEIAHLAGAQLRRWGAPERIFVNLNTPEDLLRIGMPTGPQRF